MDELPPKKRGRTVIVGERMDTAIQNYILGVREGNGPVNTAVVIAGARGLLLSMDKTKLAEFGGPATLSRGWARSLLTRMKFTKRMGTTAAKVTPENFDELRLKFLQEIVDIVKMEEVPPQLVLNWDQMGLNLVPASTWTMERQGTKRVRINGFKDKQMITGVFCGNLIGEFLPMQLIYGGKTKRCHPTTQFPTDWDITHNTKHWSNETTMISYIKKIIVPFVTRARDDLGVGQEQAALAIFDHFEGQLTDNVVALLEKHNIQSVIVPPNCTDTRFDSK